MRKQLTLGQLAASLSLWAFIGMQGLAATHHLPHWLPTKIMPSSLHILPPPPAYNSIAFLKDQADYHAAYALKNTARWKLAMDDARLKHASDIARQFDKAFGMPITQEKTPAIYRILQEVIHDAGIATHSAKNYYQRTRPFVFFHQTSCDPKSEVWLRQNGAYPSGHTTVGWATALILAEINPMRQVPILRRGYSYGQSRVICGVHWASDVEAGRTIGAALVASLHANKRFLLWMQAAKRNVRGMYVHQ